MLGDLKSNQRLLKAADNKLQIFEANMKIIKTGCKKMLN